MSTVLAAVDLGPSSARVLSHAAGFARLLSLDLRIVHVVRKAAADNDARVLDFCQRHVPYEIDLTEQNICVANGLVSDAILREARRADARMIVVGSTGRRAMTRLVLGSTSEAVLQGAAVPVLLVPPSDLDIITIGDRTTLHSGPVLAAVDLSEQCDRQLNVAAEMAQTAHAPLLLMTVAPSRVNGQVAGTQLRERGHQMTTKPRALIVRHGNVVDEISRCARTEGAGLVVMGLRTRPRAKPGVIAAAVLRTNRAFVLAVPGCQRGKS
jgi:nucleotide-binding universal stress UspA family protein